jgi:serine/threonine protein kinase
VTSEHTSSIVDESGDAKASQSGTLQAWQGRAEEAPPAGPETARGAAAEAAGPTLDAGALIGGRYLVEKRVSEGSYGVVYRATDREIPSHQVAIKVLFRKAEGDAARDSALRELRLIASVSHPSVVQFKDYGWLDGHLWFSMPWYEGRPLDAVIGQGDSAVPMSRAEARPIMVRIAQGLAAMHEVGIHHHDIKPENIFLAEIAGFPGGFPVLLDLGIATRHGENPNALTIEYASPEAASALLGTEHQPVGSASDVFSLALVLRNALDPSLLDHDASDNAWPRLRARATEPVPLSRRSELAFLQPYFERWLHLDPTKRPSAERFAAELAVLTAPEQKRAARLKLLKRIGPVVLAAGMVIAGLLSLVNKQTTALSAQRAELEQERESSEKLRSESAAQLDTITEQAATLGNEREQLEKALAVGRRLNTQVKQLQTRVNALTGQKNELTSQRDALLQEKQALTSQRDNLQHERQLLFHQRDGLQQEKQSLTVQRDALGREGAKLAAQRDQLIQENTRLGSQRDQLIQERARVGEERDRLTQQNASLAAQRDQLTQENARLKAQLSAPSPASGPERQPEEPRGP